MPPNYSLDCVDFLKLIPEIAEGNAKNLTKLPLIGNLSTLEVFYLKEKETFCTLGWVRS